MKFFIDGEQVTEDEFYKQDAINRECAKSHNPEDWKKIRFIVVTGGVYKNRR